MSNRPVRAGRTLPQSLIRKAAQINGVSHAAPAPGSRVVHATTEVPALGVHVFLYLIGPTEVGVGGVYSTPTLAAEAVKRFQGNYPYGVSIMGPAPIDVDQFTSVSGTFERVEDP